MRRRRETRERDETFDIGCIEGGKQALSKAILWTVYIVYQRVNRNM